MTPLQDDLLRALRARADALRATRFSSERGAEHAALRLFNGFQEGCRSLSVDLFGQTLVLWNYADPAEEGAALTEAALEVYRGELKGWRTALRKSRYAADPEERLGALVAGERLDRRVFEQGVWYALDLRLNQDASFYLDTRPLRAWLKERMAEKTVLNTFAYTGSLGAAALAGGAARVTQLDLNRRFLNLAKDSYALNGWPVKREDFLAGDFFPLSARLRRQGASFDCVILDPPFFSETAAGKVDLAGEAGRLINKARPLVNDGGWLVVVNNALFLSGEQFLATLAEAGADGYLELEQTLHAPEDCVGTAGGELAYPADPRPFNHPTKMAILRVRRKVK